MESGGLNIPDKEVDRLIQEVDFNQDDRIDYSEFLAMMKRDLKGEEVERPSNGRRARLPSLRSETSMIIVSIISIY